MYLLAGILLPVAYFYVAGGRRTRAGLDLVRLSVASGVMAAVAAWLAFGLTHREGTRIVWMSMAARVAGAPLVVGGNPEGATMAWPNSRFWPALDARERGDGAVELRAWGGEGLVGVESDDSVRFVNGTPLSSTPIAAGLLSIALSQPAYTSLEWLRCRHVVSVVVGDATARLCTKEDRMTGVEREVTPVVAELRRRGGDAPSRALVLEDSSRDLAILDEAAGPWWRMATGMPPGKVATVRVALQTLEPTVESAVPMVTNLPVHLVVRWRGTSLRAVLQRRAGGGLEIVYKPHWRFAIPPPDGIPDAGLGLWLVDEAAPDDVAIQLPFGRAHAQVREELKLANSAEGVVFDPAHRATLSPTRPRASELPGRTVRDESAPAELATSSAVVNLNLTAVTLATVRDASAGAGRMALLLAIPWLVFLAAAYGCRGNSTDVATIGLVLWGLLLVRWMLALRYLGGPSGIDEGSRSAWILTSAALVLGPGLFWMVAWKGPGDALRPPRTFFRNWLLVATAGLLVAAAVAVMARDVFLPTGVRVNWTRIGTTAAPIVVFLIGSMLGRGLWHLRRSRLFDPWSWLEGFVVACDRRSTEMIGQLRGRRSVVAWRRAGMVVFVMAIIGPGLALLALAERAGDTKLMTEVVGPTLSIALVVGVFLGTRTAFLRSSNDPIRLPVWIALGLVAMMPVVFPPLMLEFGGAMAGVVWLAPLAFALAVSGRYIGGSALAACVASVALLWGVTVPAAQLLGFQWGTERGASRLVVFEHGQGVLGMLNMAGGRGTTGQISATSLQNTIEHIWENQALAHRGDWLGMSYGQAPTHLSRVPKAVTQFDSTFSFYIQGDHGLAGGVALLLLYAIPLLVLCRALQNGKERTLVTAAALIAAGLLGDAVLHAGMNLGAIPFTGRNLPLLSAGSGTDLLRWLLLFPMIPALLNRADRYDPLPVYHTRWALPLPSVAMTLVVVWTLANVHANDALKSAFSWRADLRAVSARIAAGQVALDDSKRAVTRLPYETDGSTVLEQEAVRFNTLPSKDRGELPRDLPQALRSLISLSGYDDLLAALGSEAPDKPRRPSLFRVDERVEHDGDEELRATYLIAANPDYNSVMSFDRVKPRKDAFPRVVVGSGDNTMVLVGSAWVNGAYQQVTGPTRDDRWKHLIPWTAQLARAAAESFPPNVDTRLTLDPELQRAAQVWTRAAGRSQHQAYISTIAALDPSDRLALPPRVALTALDLRTGHVLATGSWPHVAPSASRWVDEEGEHLPPLDWLERHAPRALALRYATDHNWDRIEVGSAAKPVWAAAVIGVHKGLDLRLNTRGDGMDRETTVFGIPAGSKGWRVSTSPVWTDFRSYLATSDNRYQVRVGFLGLADAEAGEVPTEGGTSPSTVESMNPPRPWQRYPKYAARLRYSAVDSSQLTDVHQAPVAQVLRNRFGVGVARGDTDGRRASYWTGSTDDDRRGVTGLRSDRLAVLAPESTNLALDAIQSPRGYVTVLLGGGESRWSNVDLAGAFGTVVLGRPVVPRIVDVPAVVPSTRTPFPEDAARVRAGLQAVVDRGTATTALVRGGAIAALRRYGQVAAYAKTGTLSTDGGTTETSRLLLALVRWSDSSRRDIDGGIVLSLVIEHAQQGAASQVLGAFVRQNAETIARLIRIPSGTGKGR